MTSPFDAYFDQIAQREAKAGAQRVSTRVLAPGATSPAAAAEALRLGQAVGVPPSVVAGAPEVFRPMAEQRRISSALENAPRTQSWIDDAINASLAKDDIEALAWFEGVGREAKEFGQRVVEGATGVAQSSLRARGQKEQSLAAGVERSAPAFVQEAQRQAERFRFILERGVEDDLQSPMSPETRQLYEDRLQTAEQAVQNWRSVQEDGAWMVGPRGQQAERMAQGLKDWTVNTFGEAPPDDSLWADLSRGLGSFMAFVIPSLAPGGFVATAQMGADAARMEAYDRALDAGASDEDARLVANIAGLVGTSEVIPIASALNRLPRPVRNGVLAALGKVASDYAKGAIEEGTQEGLMAAFQNALAQQVYDPEQDIWTDDVGRQITVGAILGGFLSGGATAVRETRQGLEDRRMEKQMQAALASDGTSQLLTDIDAMAANTWLKANAPEKFLEAMDAAGMGDQFLYVPAEDVEQFYQSGLDDETLASLGVTREEFEERLMAGGDIAIPLSHYAANISGTDAATFFQERGTINPDEMSAAEARAFAQGGAEEAMGRISEEATATETREAQVREIADSMTQQLVAAGRAPSTARLEARVWSAFFRATAERAGLEPAALAQRFGVRVQSGMAPVATTPEPAATAAPDVAITASGREVPVTYRVVDAGALVTSQLDDGRANPAFPRELQPRDRSRDTSMEQIRKIAQNLDPRLLGPNPSAADGAPIVSRDGVVESGNGRVLAIRQAYAGNPDRAAAYREYIESLGYSTEGMAQPVLVRERAGDMTADDRQAFTREANERSNMDLSDTERAMADAAAMPDAILPLYVGGDVDLAQNRDFVRQFITGVVSDSDRGSFIDAEGRMSQRAVRRVQGALLAKAYGDARLVEATLEVTDGNIKAIGGALMDVAPAWAQMRREAADGVIAPEMDQTAALLEAVNMVRRARDEGRPLADLVGQMDVFSGDAMSPMGEAFLRVFFRDRETLRRPAGRAKVGDALAFYVDEARKTSPGADLLGETADPRALIDAATERQYGESDAQPGFFTQPARRDGEGDATASRDGDGTGGEGAGRAGGASGDGGRDGSAGADPQELGREFSQPDGSSGPRGSIQFPRGGLESGETVISLYEAADLSTFLHESGHFFLEAFTALAESDVATDDMKADLATIRNYLGAPKGQFTTEHHEKWARSFEAYLMEGKAPSLELADAFSRFRAWLTRIYRSIRGLDVELSQPVRDVMARMLATEDEIAAARADLEMTPLFRDKPPAMNDADWRTYQRMARRGQQEAEERLLRKVMDKIAREKKDWYKSEKKAVRTEVEERVNALPVYRVVEALANSRWIGGDNSVDDMRIDRDELVAQFGDGILADLSRAKLGGKRAIYAKGGASPGEVADLFGFADAGEMVEALRGAGKRADVISAEVEREMVERHGDPFAEGKLEEEALAAVHAEQQMQATVAEARTLAAQMGRSTSGMTARLYRARAKAMIGRMSVAQVSRPHQFLAAERRAARKAQDAFGAATRQGGEAKLAEAFQAKEQQVLNGFLYDEARKAEREISNGRARMRAYDKRAVRAKLEGGYIEQIDAILEAYDFRVRSKRQVARAESLAQFMDRMIAEGREAELNIDTALIDEARRKHYTKLSVDEIRGLFDTIANIDHMGRFKQKLIDRKRQRDLNSVAEAVEERIRKHAPAIDPEKKGWGRKALNLIRRPDTILIGLDGGEEMGPIYEAVKLPIDEATSVEQKMQVEMAERMEALFTKHYDPKQLRAMQERKQIVSGRQWSKAEILSLALNTGNEDNFQRIMDPRVSADSVMTREKLDILLGQLDENDWRFVQGMWDEIDSLWPELAEVSKRRTGVVPKKVQAKLMVDAPAGVSGGYYPIAYDPTRGYRAAKDEAAAWDKYTTAGHGARAAVANGMTKERVGGNGRTLLYDLSVSFRHQRETIRYITLSEAVDNAARILNHPRVFDALQQTGHEDTRKTLELWLQDTAKGPAFNTDLLNTVSRIIKNNFTLSRLAFNLKTISLQVTGLGQSAATIGKRNMARGVAAYIRRPNEMIADVVARSAFMAERQTTFQKDIYDFMNDSETVSPLVSRYRKAKTNIAKAGFYPIVKTQFLVVDMPTWLGAYDAGMQKYGDEDRAVHYADRMVARAQDSGLFADRASIERGTVGRDIRQSDFIRLFTTLGGYMLTKQNRAQVTLMQARLGVQEADTNLGRVAVAAGAATDLFLLFVFEAALMGLLYSLMTDEEDDDDLAEFMLTETGMAMIGGFPMVRDAASALRGYGGGGVYGSAMEVPASLMVQVSQGENDAALRRAIFDVIGISTGLPSTATYRAYEGLFGEATPAEALFGANPLSR